MSMAKIAVDPIVCFACPSYFHALSTLLEGVSPMTMSCTVLPEFLAGSNFAADANICKTLSSRIDG